MSPRPVLDLGPVTVRAMAGDGPDYRWRAEWYPPGEGGKMKTRSLGPRCTAAEAARRGAELLEAGVQLELSEPEPVTVRTVRDLVELWLGAQAQRADLSRHTLKAYRHSAVCLVEIAGTVAVTDVTAGWLVGLRDQLGQRFAPQTVKLHLAVLGFAWRWAARLQLVGAPPDLPAVRVPRKVRHTPRLADVAAVIEQAEGWQRLLLALAWSTGARVGELCRLRWSDLDLEQGTVVVCGKTGPRAVPLVGAGLDQARAATREGELLVGARVPATAEKRLGEALQGLCASAGVAPFTIHALRRLAVDAMARAGVDVATAAALTGHTPAVMLTHYRQVTESDLRAAAARAELGAAPGRSAGPRLGGRGR